MHEKPRNQGGLCREDSMKRADLAYREECPIFSSHDRAKTGKNRSEAVTFWRNTENLNRRRKHLRGQCF
jgi:hypothetical protein